MNTLLDSLKIDMTLAEKTRFNPYYINVESAMDGNLRVQNRQVYDLASNNYLGLANDERVKTEMKQALDVYGASLCGTPIASGNAKIFCRLENRLASFLGLSAAAVFPSCYQANNGVLFGLLPKNSLIIFDHFLHASFVQGIRLTGCPIMPFKHNDLAHLEKLLLQAKENKTKYPQICVVTESVFSTEGSIAPFKEIYGLCVKHGALSIIDDSHGIGVIGGTGRGILEHAGIENFQGIYTASLGKALAVSGGVVAGSVRFIDYLKYSCGSLIYSTALPPVLCAGLLKILDIIEMEFVAKKITMKNHTARLTHELEKKGIRIQRAEAPIVSILYKSAEDAVSLCKTLFQKGIFSTPFLPPSVSRGTAVIRLITGAKFTDDEFLAIERIIKSL